MLDDKLIDKISEKNINVDEFVESVLDDETIRTEVINLLLTNKKIMVYYNCFYVISKASEKKPELFYKYWNDFVYLLDHKNSYHRDIGLTILGNLTSVDKDKLFDNIYSRYIEHFNDDKFMTAQCFLKNMKKVVKNKTEYAEEIIKVLVHVDKICKYPQRQKELLKSDIIEVLDELYDKIDDKETIENFIKLQSDSLSPKTRKKVKEFINKHNL